MRNHLINVSLWLWNALGVYRAMRRRLDRAVRRTGRSYADFVETKYQHSINCAAGRVRSLRKRLSLLIEALPVSDEKRETPKVPLGSGKIPDEFQENPTLGPPRTPETKSQGAQEVQPDEFLAGSMYTSCFVRKRIQDIENFNSHLQSKLERLSLKLMKRDIELEKLKFKVQGLEVEVEDLRFSSGPNYDEIEFERQQLSVKNFVLEKRVEALSLDNEYYQELQAGSSETALAKRVGKLVLDRNIYNGISNSSICQTLEKWSIHQAPEVKDLLAMADATERNVLNGFWKLQEVFKEYKKEFKKYSTLSKTEIVEDYRNFIALLESVIENFHLSYPQVIILDSESKPVEDGDERFFGEPEDQEDYEVRFHTPLDGSRPGMPRFTASGSGKPQVFSTKWRDGHE